jgi:hypothetical protein
MSDPFYPIVLTSNLVPGPTISAWTTAVTVLDAADVVPLPGNFLKIGRKLKMTASGTITTTSASANGTITFQAMMKTLPGTGGTNVVAWTSGSIQLDTAAVTGVGWKMETILRVGAVDAVQGTAAGTLAGRGTVVGLPFQLGSGVVNATVSDDIIIMPAASSGQGTAYASSSPLYLDLWVGFSVANVVLIEDYTVEQLN